MEKADLWVIDLSAGNRARAVTTGGKVKFGSLSWAPDGSAVVFFQPQPNGQEMDVYRLDIATGQVTNLTADSPVWDAFPVWSPDGKWIAFVSDRAEGGKALDDICVMRPDGSGFRKLSDNNWEDEYPAWSPDGKQIAFLRYSTAAEFLDMQDKPGGPGGLWVIDADGSNQKLVVKLRAVLIHRMSVWSPDGKYIAFVMNDGCVGRANCGRRRHQREPDARRRGSGLLVARLACADILEPERWRIYPVDRRSRWLGQTRDTGTRRRRPWTVVAAGHQMSCIKCAKWREAI
jgi:Tol biopolymer transport system component